MCARKFMMDGVCARGVGIKTRISQMGATIRSETLHVDRSLVAA